MGLRHTYARDHQHGVAGLLDDSLRDTARNQMIKRAVTMGAQDDDVWVQTHDLIQQGFQQQSAKHLRRGSDTMVDQVVAHDEQLLLP